MKKLIDKLYLTNCLNKEELLYLLDNLTPVDKLYLTERAHKTRLKYYNNKVFLRGLIEFTNYCKNSCVYCGINSKNSKAIRYRLSFEDILNCCKTGYELGYRTFVLQGGEDSYFTDDKMIDLIKTIKSKYPKCALTLSIGEKSYNTYKKFFEAGADRYLLRHESASKSLYQSLHPNMSFSNRIECLKNLKDIGFQVGAGFMVGLPTQSNKHYVDDLSFLKQLNPHMVGIGPFISHKDTKLCNYPNGTLEITTTLLSIVRLLLPHVLLPATTALATIDPLGRQKGLLCGCNVIMPNLSPINVRQKYSLYDNKLCSGNEAAEYKKSIEQELIKCNLCMDHSRGDNLFWKRK